MQADDRCTDYRYSSMLFRQDNQSGGHGGASRTIVQLASYVQKPVSCCVHLCIVMYFIGIG